MRHVGGSELLDREPELELVRRVLTSAKSGVGAVLIIEGDSGIGKTTLIRAAVQLARDQGACVLTARGGELEEDLPFGVVRELFANIASPNSGGHTAAWTGAAKLAEPALAGVPEPENCDSFSILHGLYWLTAGLTEAGPAVLVVDDLHWCDLPSLRFLSYLARRIESLPVIILVAVLRDADVGAQEILNSLAAEPLSEVVRLRELGRSAVSKLISHELGRTVEPEFSEACRRATRGNPFLVLGLAAAIGDSGIHPVANEIPRVAALAPQSVGQSVSRQLGRLPAAAAILARTVAILGDCGDLSIAAAMTGIPKPRAAELTDTLVRAGLLARDRNLTFVHPIVRSALYNSVGPGELAAAHRRAADLLIGAGASNEMVVPHILAGETCSDPRAVEVLVEQARTRPGARISRNRGSLSEKSIGRTTQLLTDLMEALGEAYWLYLGFSGADLLGDPEYLGLRAAARRAIGGTFVRYPGSGLDPPALNAGAQSLVDAFEEPASIPIAHLGDILTTMTHQLGVPSPKASSGSGTGGEDVVIKLKDWAHTLDTPAAAVCLAGLLEANSQPELAVRLLDHIVRKEEHLRESPSFPLAAINYGRLGQAWGRFVHVPDLNDAQSNASVESLQSLLRLAGTPYEYQASIWASCAMLWNGDGATAISSARALVAALVSKDSTEKPEDLVDSWLAAAQIAFITLYAGLFEGCITNVGIARKCAGLSGDVVRAARVGAIELLLHSVTTNGVDVEELAQQRSEELAEARRVGDRLTLGFRQLAFGRWLTGAGRRSAILPDNAVEIANKALRELGDARETLRSLNLDPWVCVADLQAVKALGDLCAADQNPEHRDALVDETQTLINGILNSGAADRFRILEPQIWEVAGQIGRQFGAAGAADFFRRAVMTAERTGQLNRAVLASRDLANAAAVP